MSFKKHICNATRVTDWSVCFGSSVRFFEFNARVLSKICELRKTTYLLVHSKNLVKVNCNVEYLSINRNDNTVTVTFKITEMVNVRKEATIERSLS